jgi:hypothetical protein
VDDEHPSVSPPLLGLLEQKNRFKITCLRVCGISYQPVISRRHSVAGSLVRAYIASQIVDSRSTRQQVQLPHRWQCQDCLVDAAFPSAGAMGQAAAGVARGERRKVALDFSLAQLETVYSTCFPAPPVPRTPGRMHTRHTSFEPHIDDPDPV